MKAPFPWFGGKSRCAHLVWERFGDVPNYVEPFAGSLATLLLRPTDPRTETVNDLDCYLANFWRAVQWAPDEVAYWADWPVNEADLHARHRWLVQQKDFRERVRRLPYFYNAQIAGWWVWGISQWIGSGWCARPEWQGRTLPGRAPRGIHSEKWKVRPNLTKTNGLGEGTHARVAGEEIWQKRPALHRGSRGVFASRILENGELSIDQRRPHLSGDQGVQVHEKTPTFKRALGSGVLRTEIQGPKESLPQLSGDGSGAGRGVFTRAVSENLRDYMQALCDRLRRVRVCCGDWKRILGPSPTTCIGLTGVFLDPPYALPGERDAVYNHDSFDLANEVREWALAHGHDPKLRIALCGYAGEHPMPPDWECVPWKANGGYGNQSKSRGRANAGRERIWFSPHCLKTTHERREQAHLFMEEA